MVAHARKLLELEQLSMHRVGGRASRRSLARLHVRFGIRGVETDEKPRWVCRGLSIRVTAPCRAQR
jgi:hypothetical protein